MHCESRSFSTIFNVRQQVNNVVYKKCVVYVFFVLMASVSYSQVEQKQKHVNTGFVDFNGYYDTRDFSVLTINILAKLPHRFQYFSLTNYQGPSNSSDVSGFYAEHNVRWGVSKDLPFDLTYQFVTRQGVRNDDHRIGVRWRVTKTPKVSSFFKKVGLFYSVNPMFVEFRGKRSTKFMTIIEHVYRLNLLPNRLDNRIYIGGFADQNFVKSLSGEVTTEWVTEHQLGLRIIDQLRFHLVNFLVLH